LHRGSAEFVRIRCDIPVTLDEGPKIDFVYRRLQPETESLHDQRRCGINEREAHKKAARAFRAQEVQRGAAQIRAVVGHLFSPTGSDEGFKLVFLIDAAAWIVSNRKGGRAADDVLQHALQEHQYKDIQSDRDKKGG